MFCSLSKSFLCTASKKSRIVAAFCSSTLAPHPIQKTNERQIIVVIQPSSIMMSRLVFVGCILALVGTCSAGDVVVGTEKNFDSLLKDNKFVLAEFYAP
jgi:hypothetical protein